MNCVSTFADRPARLLCLTALIAAIAALPTLAATTDDTDAATMLFIQAASNRTSQHPAHRQYRLVTLQAATRLAPHLVPAQRDLAAEAFAIGRIDIAAWADRNTLAATPQHALAQLELIDIELAQLQTYEAKRSYIEKLLSQNVQLLPEVLSNIYTRLGDYAWQSYDTVRAEKFLRQAVDTAPQNLQAQRLLTTVVLANPKTSLATALDRQLDDALAAMQAHPFDANACLQLAVLAGTAGSAVDLDAWLQTRSALLKSLNRPDILTPAETADLAQACLSAGLAAKAFELLQVTLTSPTTTTTKTQPTTQPTWPLAVEARIRALFAIAARKTQHDDLADTQEQWFQKLADTAAVTSKPANGSADAEANGRAVAAIFVAIYGRSLDNPTQTALTLARAAEKTARIPSATVKTALALALARAADPTAQTALAELPNANSPMVSLAKVWLATAQGNTTLARSTLSAALANAGPGPIRDEMLTLWTDLAANAAPPEPKLQPVLSKLAGIDRANMLTLANLSSALHIELLTQGRISVGDPVALTVALTNTGKTPIAIGPGGLVSQQVAIRIDLNTAGRLQSFVVPVILDGRQILAPGQRTGATTFLTLATGNQQTLIAAMSATPKVDRIVVTPILLSSSADSGDPAAVLRTGTPITLAGFDFSADGQTLLNMLDQPASIDFSFANRVAWLAGDPRRQSQAQAVFRGILKKLSTAADAPYTAALLFSLRYAQATPDVFNALAARMTSRSWLTRLIALDSLARLQKKGGLKLYQYYAQNDADPLVRQLATSFLLTDWSQAQP